MSTRFSILRIQAELRKESFRNEILSLAGFKTAPLQLFKYHQKDDDKDSTFQSFLFYHEATYTIDESRHYFQMKIQESISDSDLESKKPLQSMCDSEGGSYVIFIFKDNNSCLTLEEIKAMFAPVRIIQLLYMIRVDQSSTR